MELVIWIASGLLTGWLAGLLMKGRDYGFSGNTILGLLGSVVGGWVMHWLGFMTPSDLWKQLVVSLLGAMLVLGVARRLRPVARSGRKAIGEAAGVADLETQIRRLGEFEKRALRRLLGHKPVPDPNAAFEAQMTFGQRVADRVAAFGGSWTFIGIFLLFMLVWMLLNSEHIVNVDPFPFILLNLILSCLAALQAPVIMMSQNRQSAKDRSDAQHDYEVNLRAELEIQRLHTQFDELRERDWASLVELQQRQIGLLEDIIRCVDRERGGEAG